MTWLLLFALVVVLAFALAVRRRELVGMASEASERALARERGTAKARLQYPHVDLSRCIGCGICVAACPEDGVLGLVHGQAVVLHGARCVGHGRCAEECPVGAIAVTLADIEERRDLPAVSEHFESLSAPGVFLAGEVTGYALVRTAITQGIAVADEIARRVAEGDARGADETLDLCIVGAGPAGIACALRAKEAGLEYLVLEQESAAGGTVAKYPRRKLVMTQPVELPLHGKLSRDCYSKEELMELWEQVTAEHQLAIHTGQEFVGIAPDSDGAWIVHTKTDRVRARHVCLALGRRGTPRKLGVPGEELPKVSYSLLDAHSYQDRRILVVGGGDSAVEAALGLAEQPNNRVTLSYRRSGFSRLKSRNERRIAAAIERCELDVLFESEVEEIGPGSARLRVGANGSARSLELENDEVFVFAGGVAPFELLEKSGVSFDPALRPETAPPVERGTNLVRALAVALVLSLAALAWTLLQLDYYAASAAERALHRDHALLRSSGGLGILLGATASALIAANLLYLARRAQLLRWFALQNWMTAHVVTGVLALLTGLVHAAMAPRATVGGHALWALAFLVLTGAIGRYFYSFVPRAANGRELALDEVRARVARIAGEWDRAHREFGERVRERVQQLVAASHWQGSFLRRVRELWRSQRALSAAVVELRAEALALDLPEDQIDELAELARTAHRTAIAAAHYEDLRGILASWRYFHRWVALLMVLLVILHVIAALRYGEIGG